MIALDALVEGWFTPKDEDDQSPTKFKLKPLSGADSLELLPLTGISQDGKQVIFEAKALEILIRKGLCGWENFNDKDGRPLDFIPANIGRIPMLKYQEIAIEIYKRTEIFPDAKKK